MILAQTPQIIERTLLTQLKVQDLDLSLPQLERKIDSFIKDSSARMAPIKGLSRGWACFLHVNHGEPQFSVRMILTDDHHHLHIQFLSPLLPHKSDEGIVGWQPVEWRKVGARIVGIVQSFGADAAYPAAIFFQKHGPNWKQVFAYSNEKPGTMEFLSKNSLDAIETVRDTEPSHLKAFPVPAWAAPHLILSYRWHFGRNHYTVGKPRTLHNAFYAFDDLVHAIQTHRIQRVRLRCPNPMLRVKLSELLSKYSADGQNNRPQLPSPSCPGSYQNDDGHVFGFRDSDLYFEMRLNHRIWQLVRTGPEKNFLKRDIIIAIHKS